MSPQHTHSGHAGTQHPIYFRSWNFSGTVVNVDFLSAEPQASVNMNGLPLGTPPGMLIIHHTSATPVDLVLKGEDGVTFTHTLPGEPVTGAGVTQEFRGGVTAIVAAGSGAIQKVTACWYQSGAAPRRKIGA